MCTRVSLTEQFCDRFERVTLTVNQYWPLHHYLAWFYKRGKRGSYLVLAIAPFLVAKLPYFLVAKLFGRKSGVTRTKKTEHRGCAQSGFEHVVSWEDRSPSLLPSSGITLIVRRYLALSLLEVQSFNMVPFSVTRIQSPNVYKSCPK